MADQCPVPLTDVGATVPPEPLRLQKPADANQLKLQRERKRAKTDMQKLYKFEDMFKKSLFVTDIYRTFLLSVGSGRWDKVHST